jgi:methylphosphotriester-DNA--protein-cysteine methyltransferase
MRLQTLTPHPEIAPFIHHFWIFESASGLPTGDARVVVPNGRHKLIVPYQNGLSARRVASGEHAEQHYAPGQPALIGLWEEPTILSSSMARTCTIGVEFLPHGLRHFLRLSADQLTQQIVPLADVLGRSGMELGERVGGAANAQQAGTLVNDFLRACLRRRQMGSAGVDVVHASLSMLAASNYRMEVNELERRMGYSRRYLHALFLREVGLAPKRLASVLTFERLYRRFSQQKSVTQLKHDALELFYDQAHFIRNFRRFSGFAPGKFAELQNEFGRIFYVDNRP